jgi:hypothetical protein
MSSFREIGEHFSGFPPTLSRACFASIQTFIDALQGLRGAEKRSLPLCGKHRAAQCEALEAHFLATAERLSLPR